MILKTSEGQLFHERLKDIFLVACLFIFSGISRTATHFAITMKKNITGNKVYVLKLPCEKNFFNLFQSRLNNFVHFRPGQI